MNAGVATFDVLLGASGGSGRLVAWELAGRGLSVWLDGRRLTSLTDLAGQLSAAPAGVVIDSVVLHLTDAANVRAVVGLSRVVSTRVGPVSRREWASLPQPRRGRPAVPELMLEDIVLPGLRWRPVTPRPADEPDPAVPATGYHLFGGASAMLLPSPGHIPGPLAMLVRQPGAAALLMVGDVTYDAYRLQGEHIPGVGQRTGSHRFTQATNLFHGRYPDVAILAARGPATGRRPTSTPV